MNISFESHETAKKRYKSLKIPFVPGNLYGSAIAAAVVAVFTIKLVGVKQIGKTRIDGEILVFGKERLNVLKWILSQFNKSYICDINFPKEEYSSITTHNIEVWVDNRGKKYTVFLPKEPQTDEEFFSTPDPALEISKQLESEDTVKRMKEMADHFKKKIPSV